MTGFGDRPLAASAPGRPHQQDAKNERNDSNKCDMRQRARGEETSDDSDSQPQHVRMALRSTTCQRTNVEEEFLEEYELAMKEDAGVTRAPLVDGDVAMSSAVEEDASMQRAPVKESNIKMNSEPVSEENAGVETAPIVNRDVAVSSAGNVRVALFCTFRCVFRPPSNMWPFVGCLADWRKQKHRKHPKNAACFTPKPSLSSDGSASGSTREATKPPTNDHKNMYIAADL